MLLEALNENLSLLFSPSERVEDWTNREFFTRLAVDPWTSPRVLCPIARSAQDIDRDKGAARAEEMLPLTSDEAVQSIHEFDAANDIHRDDQAVLVTSCHGAKGLEFQKVILLTDGFEPTGEDVRRCGSEQRAWEEKRRLFYVAMTRAKEELSYVGPMRIGW